VRTPPASRRAFGQPTEAGRPKTDIAGIHPPTCLPRGREQGLSASSCARAGRAASSASVLGARVIVAQTFKTKSAPSNSPR